MSDDTEGTDEDEIVVHITINTSPAVAALDQTSAAVRNFKFARSGESDPFEDRSTWCDSPVSETE